MGRVKKAKPILAIHYSCTCCGIRFVDEEIFYLRTGCERCGSSLAGIEVYDETALKLAKINVGVPMWNPDKGDPLKG